MIKKILSKLLIGISFISILIPGSSIAVTKQFQVDTGGTLTTELVSYYKLEDVNDFFGTNNLTNTGGATFGAGKVNNDVQFNGSSNYLWIADNASLSVGDIDFSVGMWIKTPSFTSTGTIQIPLLKGDNSGNNVGYGFYFNGNGVLHWLVRKGDNLGYVDVLSSVTMSVDTWYWVVGYHDSVNNLAGIQVNNGTADTLAITTGVLNDTANFSIGAEQNGAGYFRYYTGAVDEVIFSKKLFSAQEKTDLYNGGAGQTMITSSPGPTRHIKGVGISRP